MIDIAILDSPTPKPTQIDVGNGDCYTYLLEGERSCGATVNAPAAIYVNTVLNPVRYEEQEEVIDSNGKITRTYLMQKKVYSFFVDVDDEWLDKMKSFGFFDTFYLTKKGGNAEEVANLKVGDPTPVDDSGIYQLEITFEDPAIQEISGCCGGLFDGDPYDDPCDDGSGNGGQPPVDPCAGFGVSLAYDGSAINATATGGGTPTYKWYYDASGNGAYVLLTSGGVSSVVPAGSGRYRVIAQRGGCQDIDEILVQDECSLFEVILTIESGVISSRIISGQGNPSYTWFYTDENGESQLPDTTDSIVPDGTGFYRLEVDDENCSGEDTVFFEAEEECIMDVEISRSEDTLTAVVDDCDGSKTYEWSKDDGSGMVVIGTGPTAQVDGNGVYFATVQCGDLCTRTAYLVNIEECNPCAGLEISVSESDGTLTATTSGGSGGLITWYVNAGNGKQVAGTGNSVQVSVGGMYTAEWEVDGCKVSSEYLECRTGDDSISFDEICE